MLLSVEDLFVEFRTYDGTVRAVNGVSFQVDKGETLGIVGESGSGKSVATHAILQLVPVPPGRIAGGAINFDGRNLLAMPEDDINKVRGKDIGMIFQEPMTSLNPVYTVENQITEALKLHFPPMSRAEYAERVEESLAAVGIPSPGSRMKCYPHELSGGMRQRVMIAMALACGPRLLVADEPTTALDVTIQAQILDILVRLQESRGLAVILITHDLGVVAETAHRVIVMYAGRVVESGTTGQIFNEPLHPYTIGLLESIPSYASAEAFDLSRRLKTIHGMVPDMRCIPPGCAFAERCFMASPECRESAPVLRDIGIGHCVACIKR